MALTNGTRAPVPHAARAAGGVRGIRRTAWLGHDMQPSERPGRDWPPSGVHDPAGIRALQRRSMGFAYPGRAVPAFADKRYRTVNKDGVDRVDAGQTVHPSPRLNAWILPNWIHV